MTNNSNTTLVIAQVYIKIDGTPLASDLLNDIESIEVELELNLPAMCTIRLHDSEFVHIDDTKFDLAKELSVSFKSSTQSQVEVFKGEIVVIQPEFTETEMTLKIVALDKLHRLSRGTYTRTFVDVTDSDVISQLASPHGLSVEVDSTTAVHKHVFQDNTSDLAMLHMLARRNNLQIDCHTGVLKVKARNATTEIVAKFGNNLHEFRPRLSAPGQVGKVEVRGWNTKNKQAIVGTKTSSATVPTVGYGKTVTAATSTFGADDKLVEVRFNALDQSEAEKIAQARLDELNAEFLIADGYLEGNENLAPGVKLKVEQVGTRFSGNYVVTRACHSYTYERGYITEFTVEGLRASQISTLIAPREDPPRLWHGVVPAVVTNNADDSSQPAPNQIGRVKVKFPWLDDTKESYWARVVSVDAGNGRGLLTIPEVGDEVLVAFENGDFNRPYVLGGLWNGVDALPVAQTQSVADGKVIKRYWKTRTGHILDFTESDQDSYIQIKVAAVGYYFKIDGKNKLIEVTDGSANKVVIDVQSKKISVAAENDIELTAKNIKLTASEKLTALGNNGVDIASSAGKTTVKGTSVEIN